MLVENNLDVLDQTQAAAAAPAARFELFQGARAIDAGTADRALYLGLTGPISSGSLVLLADAADQDGAGPPGGSPDDRRLATGDRGRPTESLRRRGMITISPTPTRSWSGSSTGRVWPGSGPDRPAAGDGPACGPRSCTGSINAVGISQARTVEDEILGSSLGEPGMTVELAEGRCCPTPSAPSGNG